MLPTKYVLEILISANTARDETVDSITVRNEQASNINVEQNTAYEKVRVMDIAE